MRQKLLLFLALLCTIVQGAWAQSSWDEVYAITQTNSANWTQLSAGSTTGKTLGTANATTYYYADTNLTFSNSTVSGSGLTILGTVYFYVPDGVTVTCTGAHANGQMGGGAGIELTEGNTLYLLGSGTLNATGGNAADGGNGTNGSDASCKWDDMEWAWVGGNGHGGNGGGGAGAGIGTRGANGGNGGIAPEKEIYYKTWTQNGVVGGDGSAGQTAGAKGELHVSKDITINATGGSQGSAGTAGSAGKSCMRYGGNEYSIPGGGGGGAGGFGGAANNIGPGGPGGGGGGGGAKGSHDLTSTGFYIIYANGGAGGQNGDGSYAATGGTAGVSTANINNGTCDTNNLSWVQAEERGKESSDVNTTTNGGAGGACGTSIINDVVSSETTTMTSGTYTVLFDVTVQSRIQISGNVTLNLGEGAMLTANKGIEVSNGNSLTINGPGALTVPGADSEKAGIGALRAGTLTINGGTIDVTGGEQAAGIGGDCENRDGGTIIINGGVVTAKGLNGGAGIGGGNIGGWHDGCGRCGTVVINGGQVTAIGYGGAAGIGPGHIPGFHTYSNEGGSLTIGWTRLTDFVYSSGYSNNDNLGLSSIVFADGKRFMIEETGVGATSGNIAGKKIVPIPETELSGSGAENDPYLINDPDDWYLLFAKIAQGTSYSGQFVQLNSDISVSTMVGISETNSFQGTFLGEGHTITAAMTDNINGGAAPFRYIKNATIKNLTVAGTITSNQRHMSGLVGFADSEGEGKNLIEDCAVTATLNINTDYAGGIVGHGKSSATTIRGCVFAGTMNSNSNPNVGVIWGWSDSATPTLENSLEAGTYTGISKLHPMGLQKAAGTITNCYYTTPQIGSPENACTVSGAKQAYAFVSAPPNLGNLEHNYGTMTVYENGILFGGIYYVASTTVSLADNSSNSTTISGANGYFADVTLTDRTLYKDGKWNTLCLPFNVDSFTDTPLEGATVKTLASTSFTGGTLTMNFTDDVTSIEAGKPYIVKWEYNVVDLSTLTANYTAQDGETLTGTLGGNYKISIADGATVKLQDVTINGVNTTNCIWAGINCSGDATIFLKGTNNVRGFYENYSGIYVPSGSTLTIKGSGSLNASSNGYGAGIGGGYRISCGNIVIEGGTINATGGEYAAGIGGGYQTPCGTITITDGVTKVTATKGNSAPNSIGAGEDSFCGTVTVGGVEGAIVNNHTYTGTGSGSVDVASILPDFVNPVFSGVIISNVTANAETDYVDFIGTYSPVSIYTDEKTNLYLGADNKLYYPTATDFTVNAFRGYFQLKGLTAGEPNSNQAFIRAFKLNFGDGDDNATGIVSAEENSSLFTLHSSLSEWYTLDGRKLSGKPTQRGIYIHGGKKVVVK